MSEDLIKLLEQFLHDNELEWEWFEKIESFCKSYSLNIKYITEVLNDPKVIPMIRGKFFEFTVQDELSKILANNYLVTNPRLNPQAGYHDIDVAIINQKNAKKYSAECKLAKKGSFRLQGGIRPFIEVKCMRSRTLGDKAAEQRSKLIGIPSTSLNIHKDQYIETDFDLVITSLANAFFQTNLETGLFVWKPTPKEQIFLSKININNQEEALLKMYVARSKDLTANQTNNINCSRQKCHDNNCNFIPNYPKIFFDVNTAEPLQPWLPIEKIEDLLD
jgi:hypothetical protein